MVKRARPTAHKISLEEIELAVNSYDVACDYPNENFLQTAKRAMPQGWNTASATFRREARKMYDLAR